MPSEPKMLPCPFCGGVAERIDIEDGENYGGSCISCSNCHASSNVEFGFKEGLVSNWNRRAIAVKALEWNYQPVPPTGEYLATSPVGLYCIPAGGKSFTLRFRDRDIGGPYPSLEAARAAAQADYETRIRSALVDPEGGV